MFSKVVNSTLTPLQSFSPPGDASSSQSSLIPIPLTHAPPQATVSVPPQSNVRAPSQTWSATPPTGGVVENLSHKSDLNSYCQRLCKIPVYQTAREGFRHALKFRSTVSVGQKIFASPNAFSNRKSAEQDAAKLALQHLLNEDEAIATNLRGNLRKLVCQDKARCKMILNEFLAKTKMECAYETIQVEKTPVFVSYLALNGTCYIGEGGKNKKDAEKLAALAAILSLLDDPTYATPISEVIKSKFNASAVFNETLKDFPNTRDCSVTGNQFRAMPLSQHVLPIGQSSFRVLVDEQMPTLQANNIEAQGWSGILVNKNNQDLVTSLPQTETRGVQGVLVDKQGVAGNQNGAVAISKCSYVNLLRTSPIVFSNPQHGIELPEAAQQAYQQISVPIEFVQPPAHNPANDPISSKRRRRMNKKANKRLRAENKPAGL